MSRDLSKDLTLDEQIQKNNVKEKDLLESRIHHSNAFLSTSF